MVTVEEKVAKTHKMGMGLMGMARPNIWIWTRKNSLNYRYPLWLPASVTIIRFITGFAYHHYRSLNSFRALRRTYFLICQTAMGWKSQIGPTDERLNTSFKQRTVDWLTVGDHD